MAQKFLVAFFCCTILTSCTKDGFKPETLELVESACADWEKMRETPGYISRVILLDGISGKFSKAALIEDSAKLLALSNYTSNSANTSTNLKDSQRSPITDFCLTVEK